MSEPDPFAAFSFAMPTFPSDVGGLEAWLSTGGAGAGAGAGASTAAAAATASAGATGAAAAKPAAAAAAAARATSADGAPGSASKTAGRARLKQNQMRQKEEQMYKREQMRLQQRADDAYAKAQVHIADVHAAAAAAAAGASDDDDDGDDSDDNPAVVAAKAKLQQSQQRKQQQQQKQQQTKQQQSPAAGAKKAQNAPGEPSPHGQGKSRKAINKRKRMAEQEAAAKAKAGNATANASSNAQAAGAATPATAAKPAAADGIGAKYKARKLSAGASAGASTTATRDADADGDADADADATDAASANGDADADADDASVDADMSAATAALAGAGDAAAAAAAADRVARRKLKKQKKKLEAGKVVRDVSSLSAFLGAGARASLDLSKLHDHFRNGRHALKSWDVQELVLWVLGEAVSPSWAFVKNRPLVTRVVWIVVDGLTEQLLHTAAWGRQHLPALTAPAATPAATAPTTATATSTATAAASSASGSGSGPFAATHSMALPLFVATSAYSPSSVMHGYLFAQRRRLVSKTARKKDKKEKGKNQEMKPQLPDALHYVLTEQEQRENKYPVQGDADTKHFVPTLAPEVTAAVRNAAAQAQGAGTARRYRLFGIDCEMCFTKVGLELTRVTVVDERHTVLLDRLVKPLNPITDYNTRFSGITAHTMAGVTLTLADVQKQLQQLWGAACTGDGSQPAAALVLVGHSLENDLRALQMLHSSDSGGVIDTALLYPHPRGKPYKSSLKFLAQKYLKKAIQTGASNRPTAAATAAAAAAAAMAGTATVTETLNSAAAALAGAGGGHNSVEDAVTALQLAQLKIANGPSFASGDDSDTENLLQLLVTRYGRSVSVATAGMPPHRAGAAGAGAAAAAAAADGATTNADGSAVPRGALLPPCVSVLTAADDAQVVERAVKEVSRPVRPPSFADPSSAAGAAAGNASKASNNSGGSGSGSAGNNSAYGSDLVVVHLSGLLQHLDALAATGRSPALAALPDPELCASRAALAVVRSGGAPAPAPASSGSASVVVAPATPAPASASASTAPSPAASPAPSVASSVALSPAPAASSTASTPVRPRVVAPAGDSSDSDGAFTGRRNSNRRGAAAAAAAAADSDAEDGDGDEDDEDDDPAPAKRVSSISFANAAPAPATPAPAPAPSAASASVSASASAPLHPESAAVLSRLNSAIARISAACPPNTLLMCVSGQATCVDIRLRQHKRTAARAAATAANGGRPPAQMSAAEAAEDTAVKELLSYSTRGVAFLTIR